MSTQIAIRHRLRGVKNVIPLIVAVLEYVLLR
jgi:hypothetical protein